MIVGVQAIVAFSGVQMLKLSELVDVYQAPFSSDLVVELSILLSSCLYDLRDI